jgi:hypothetical protein
LQKNLTATTAEVGQDGNMSVDYLHLSIFYCNISKKKLKSKQTVERSSIVTEYSFCFGRF